MPDGEARAAGPAVVWRSPGARLALAALPAWFTVAVLTFSTPWSLKLIVGAIVAVTAASPTAGLLSVAALTPVGHLLAVGIGIDTFRLSEAIVLAFLTTWVL
ncbi:MAG: hypothetical protein ACHQO8_11295, partial [Vicinamibacterales bacterium]